MRTLSIDITDSDFSKFGLKDEKLSFSQLLEIVSTGVAKNALEKSLFLAEKYSLSSLSIDEITNEVRAFRLNAKNNS